MKKVLTAREIVKGAWNGKKTWSKDRIIAVGKVSRNQAFEIVYQPSNEDFGTPWKVSIATYNPDNNTFKGQYIDNFTSQQLAELFVGLYKREVETEAVSNKFISFYNEFFKKDVPNPNEIDAAASLYNGVHGKVWEHFDPVFHKEFGLVLVNELKRLGN